MIDNLYSEEIIRTKKEIDILFCGLVRKKDLFKKSLKELISLRKRGFINKIIFSTWKGEIQQNPEIYSFFKANDILLIESEEPKERGVGSIWCQMKAMEIGLKYVEDKRFVLKTRSDVYITPEFLKKLVREKEELLKIKKSLPRGNIFKYKIWVPWFDLTKVFFMADECFFGYKKDLKHLINYDKSYDSEYKVWGGISHIRRYIHPFLKEYPILYSSLLKYSKEGFFKNVARKFSEEVFDLRKLKILKKVHESNKFINLKKRLNNDEEYVDCLATYYSILFSHFFIDSRSFENQVTFRDASKPSIKLNAFNASENFNESKVFEPNSGRIYVYDMEFIKNLCNKRLEDDEISLRLIAAIDKFNNQN